MSPLEGSAAVLAIAYLVLAIRQNILCWAAALISSLLYIVVFLRARLYMESGVNLFYAAMALYGWYEWRLGGARHEGVRINVWPLRYHLLAVALIAAMTFVSGQFWRSTNAASPYLDSFTTIAALVTTFMVARKVLENWLYWFVIDSVSVYLFMTRELYLTSLLFVVYLILIVVGFRDWMKDWRGQNAEREATA
jgi:nicotinamide mononucleotide transporter